MKKEELFKYFKLKYNELLVAFEVIFRLNSSETDKVILQLLSSNDTFYNLSNYEFLDIKSLVNLKKYLIDINLTEDEIKTLLIDIPYIIFYSNCLDNIYPLFSYDEFQGIVFLNDNSYKAYISPFVSEEYKFDLFRNMSFNSLSYDDIVSLNVKNQFENNKFIEDLIKMGCRSDIVRYYGLDYNYTLKDIFDVCSSRRTGGNLHFYKLTNSMLERKAKKSSKIDDFYICDMCDTPHDDINIKYIIPHENGGSGDVYNMACLCDECLKYVNNEGINLLYQNNVLVRLRRRMYIYPEYSKVLSNLYNIGNVEFYKKH